MPRLVHPQHSEPEPSEGRRIPYGVLIRILVYAIACLALVLVILRTVQDL